MSADVRRAARRANLSSQRGTVVLAADGPRQRLQIKGRGGQVLDRVERMADYGLASHPLPGAAVTVVSLGGNSNHSLVIATEDKRHRPTLLPGETAIYDDQGQVVILSRAGVRVTTPLTVEVTAGGDVTITAPTVKVVGDLEVSGTITGTKGGGSAMALAGTLVADGDVQAGGGAVKLLTHKHTGVDRGAGKTDEPEQ
jgi:phage baseplate assembly protein V